MSELPVARVIRWLWPSLVLLRRHEYEALLDRLEDAEDRATVLQHRLEVQTGEAGSWLTGDEVNRLLDKWRD